MNKKNPLKKRLSVIFGLSVSPSLINLMIALQTEYARKKITRFIPLVIFSVQFNISPTEEPYVISSVKLHITDRIPSIIPSMN
jgi:hypothetical protein